MDKILYLECYSGISGDMTVGALLDLGANQQKLIETLKSLPVDGYQLEMKRCKKCGIDSFSFDVILEQDDNEKHQNEQKHHHEQEHKHEFEHHHKHQISHHMHRNLYDINKILDTISNERVKQLAKKIFEIVARAEAKAHNLPLEDVHFHEVGAIDSIVDIVSVAFCICDLGIHEVVVSKLYEGQGHVTCQHGILPVPVPATMNIISEYRLPLFISDNQGEMVTPTGAAIAAALSTKDSLPEDMIIKAVGIGSGKKEFEQANILRAMILEHKLIAEDKRSDRLADAVWMLETNIDDCSGEALSFTMEKLFQIGAKDVFFTPIFMKKCRPAYLFSVICDEENIEECEEIIFANTTTIGIRRGKLERSMLKREIQTVDTKFGMATVKVCQGLQGKRYYPEYDSVKALSMENETDYQSVYYEVLECANKN
ncbi:MAG: nickel pincer cofactor biosynthesis protein LarC [Velocimicrobium sp.]